MNDYHCFVIPFPMTLPKIIKALILVLLALPGIQGDLIAQKSGIVTTRNGRFLLDQKEFHFIGVNYWCAAILGMEKPPGDRMRLNNELDFLAKNGVSNLRVLVSSEGDSSYPYRVFPSHQKKQGQFDDSFLEGLDYLLQQCEKRNLKTVLYFTNNWEWSGGFGQYLEWNGFGMPPMAKTPQSDWEKYCDYISRFYTCEPCTNQVNKLINKVVSRKNSLTGNLYKNDPAIFAWELANEPRPMRPTANEAYQKWVTTTSEWVKKLDPNHLLTIGCEGDVAFGWDMKPYELAHSLPNVDYLTIHIWPKNWKWFPDTAIAANMKAVLEKSQAFLDRHQEVANRLKKPLVLEEFGLPRDGHIFSKTSPVSSRNRYYQWAAQQLESSKKSGKSLSGICIWAFGGLGEFPASGQFWKRGDAFTGDPPFEEQGLNSVFESDHSTWEIFRKLKPILDP
jgi:mannan endo-1,4-beta-mannosidase